MVEMGRFKKGGRERMSKEHVRGGREGERESGREEEGKKTWVRMKVYGRDGKVQEGKHNTEWFKRKLKHENNEKFPPISSNRVLFLQANTSVLFSM